MGLLAYLRTHDPDLLNLRKSLRAMLFAAPLFALLKGVLGFETLATYAFFGCFVGVVFANFGGPAKPRAMAYAAMIVIGDLLIIIGSLLSDTVAIGALAMFVIIFLVSFAAVLGGYAPAFMAPVALSFSLAVLDPLSAAPIEPRVVGWTIGGAAALVAALVLWPIDRRPVLRRSLAEICGALSKALADTRDPEAAEVDFKRAVAALKEAQAKTSTPLRPAGPTSRDIGLLHLLALLEQAVNMTRDLLDGDGDGDRRLETPLRTACADAFRRSRAVLLEEAGPETVAQDIPELDQARLETDHAVDLAAMQAAETPGMNDDGVDPALAAVRRMFPVKALSHVAIWVEANAARAMGAGQLVRPTKTAPELRRYSDRPAALLGRIGALVSRALDPDGVIFRNSVRAAAAMSLAVIVAKVVPVDHGFWVVLAALLVLHSSAASTTATSLQAITGTLIGFVIGGLVLQFFGGNPTALWIMLPVGVFLAGYMPGVVGFMVGQTAFTLLVVVVFTLIDPAGITTDIARVETVALGAASGAVMSFIFWPHGARQALARAVEDMYRTASEALPTVPAESVEGRAEVVARMRTARRRAEEAFAVALTERGRRIDAEVWMALYRAPNMVHSLVTGFWATPSPWLNSHCADGVSATLGHRDQLSGALRQVADRLDPGTKDGARTPVATSGDDRATILAECLDRARPHGRDKVNDVRVLILLNEWLTYIDRYMVDAGPELEHAAETSRRWAWLNWSQPTLRERPS